MGTKAHQKGLDRLAIIFERLVSGIPPCICDSWHGCGPITVWISKLSCANCCHRHPRLHFPGQVGNVQDWYERADLFLLPSRYEGFPNVLLGHGQRLPLRRLRLPQGPADP